MTGLFAFLISVAFWRNISASATTPRWAIIVIVSALSLFLIRIRPTLSHVLFGLFIGYALLSLSWSEVPIEWVKPFVQLLFMFFLFCFAAERDCTKAVVIGSAIGLAVNDVVVIGQFYGFDYVPKLQTLSGLWMNHDNGGEFAALILVGAIFLRIWWIIPLAIPTIFFPIPYIHLQFYPPARGACSALLLTGFCLLLKDRPKTLVLSGILLFAVGIGAGLMWGGAGVTERIDIWLDTLAGLTWFGHGYGSYYATFPAYGHTINTLLARPANAHNDPLELIYEMGIGFILVAALCRNLWRSPLVAEKAILLCFGFESLFGFIVHMPATAALFAVMAGRCAGTGTALRDDIAHGRMVVRQWLEAFAIQSAGWTGPIDSGGKGIPV